MEGRHRGTVEWYDEALQYGFIIIESGEKVFVHGRDLGGMVLEEGDSVECILGEAGKGLQALNVIRIYSSTMA